MTTRELKGVCSSRVSYTVDEQGLVHDVAFSGGCEGNLQAIARLVEGRPAREVIVILDGITCGRKDTSCSDQFVQVLKEEGQGAL